MEKKNKLKLTEKKIADNISESIKNTKNICKKEKLKKMLLAIKIAEEQISKSESKD